MADSFKARVQAVEDDGVWRPRLLRYGVPEERAELEAIAEQRKVRHVRDVAFAQLCELMESRHPDQALKLPQQQELAKAFLGDTPVDEFGVWVFFPWSGELAHVLPKEMYRELRGDRNRYKITAAEQARLQSSTVAVSGLSVGQASALTLALEGVGGKYRLADFDTLSLANMNRLRAGVFEYGLHKGVIAARHMFEIDPFLEIEMFLDGVREENLDAFLDGVDLLVEECDDIAMKIRLRERCKELRIPVIMDTSDRGMLDVERYDLEPELGVFFGTLGDVRASQLEGLTKKQKLPVMLRILGGPATMSERAAGSAIEIDETICSWPQLASGVALGGALTTDVARRILLGHFRSSGRFFVEIDKIISDEAAPAARQLVPEPGVIGLMNGFEPKHLHTPIAPPPPLKPATSDALTDAQARTLVEYAIRAPSQGNCQPWRFEWTGSALNCLHDYSRTQRSFQDFRRAATLVTMGTAVENVRIAAAAMGLSTGIELMPDPKRPEVLVSLRFTRGPVVQSELLPMIGQRATNRRFDRGEPLTPALLQELEQVVAEAGGKLLMLTEPAQLHSAAKLMGWGDRFVLHNEACHREMFSEFRWSPEEVEATRDGIPVTSLELSQTDLAGMRIVSKGDALRFNKRIGGGQGLESVVRKGVEAASAVGMITMPEGHPGAFFKSGMAAQRLWLSALTKGCELQPMTGLLFMFFRLQHGDGFSPDEIRTLRNLHRSYLELFPIPDGHQEGFLFRLMKGAGQPTARAIRRPVDEVFSIAK